MPYYISPPPANPLTRMLAALVGALALVGAFFFGIFVLAIVLGLGFIAWLAFSLRVWWLRRQQGAAASPPDSGAGSSAADSRQAGGGEVIDAEYTVVSRRNDP
jgi:hypothetical protein